MSEITEALREIISPNFNFSSNHLEILAAKCTPDNIDEVDSRMERSLLSWAAYGGAVTAVNKLLENGANVNLRDKRGGTPIIHAVHSGIAGIIMALVEAGCNVNHVDDFGMRALDYAIKLGGRYEVINVLLGAGANVDHAMPDTYTYLMSAVSNNDSRLVQLLLDHKADPNQGLHFKHTPLTLAVRAGKWTEIVCALLAAGADVNKPGKYGRTPLFYAVANNYPEMQLLTQLLERGADVNKSDNGGVTPLRLGREGNAGILLRSFAK